MKRKWKTTRWRKLTRFDIDWGKEIPERPGVYALYLENSLLYIGSSSNLKSRLNNHPFVRRSDSVRTDFKYLKFKVCSKYGEWLMLEARLIKRAKPPLNLKGHSGFKSSIAEEVCV